MAGIETGLGSSNHWKVTGNRFPLSPLASPSGKIPSILPYLVRSPQSCQFVVLPTDSLILIDSSKGPIVWRAWVHVYLLQDKSGERKKSLQKTSK